MLQVEIAGIIFEFKTGYPAYMERMFSDYSSSKRQADIPRLDYESWVKAITNETGQGPENVEFYAISVALGELMPAHGRLQTHGVAIEYNGKAYIFSAPSGTGKSTRAFLWQKYIGEDRVTIINGDKPVLWFKGEEILACGSPWAGKEGLHRNVCVPLGGICILRRSRENAIRRAGPQEFFNAYSEQVQMPRNPQATMAALSLMEELYTKVPIFILENDRSEQGVKIAFEALTGENFETQKMRTADVFENEL